MNEQFFFIVRISKYVANSKLEFNKKSQLFEVG